MKKLCVQIYSKYKNYTQNAEEALWNSEVLTDRETVKSIFQDETIIEIKVIAQTEKRKIDVAQYLSVLRDINLSDYNECQIILNTHGASGSSDLSDEVIKAVIIAVSNADLKISKITALQCNGLKELTPREYREIYPMTPMLQSLSVKPSSMAILQGKLCHLKTKCQQSFSINGFRTAYDPVTDKDAVKHLLLNGSEHSLEVKTKLVQDELQNIDLYIGICSESRDKDGSDYAKATNELGKLLFLMKQNICTFLKGEGELDPRNMNLFQAVSKEINTGTENLSSDLFERGYKKWIKEHKIYSEERLTVFAHYCSVSDISEEEQRMSASISVLCTGKLGTFKQDFASTPESAVQLGLEKREILVVS